LTPTNELRFVERVVYDQRMKKEVTHRILQQKWIDEGLVASTHIYGGYGERGLPVKTHPHEWRDVPVEKETQT